MRKNIVTKVVGGGHISFSKITHTIFSEIIKSFS